MDPANGCKAVAIKNETVTITYNYFKASCNCSNDWINGYWKLSPELTYLVNGTQQTMYSRSPPAVCNECYNFFYGKKPGTLTYSATSLNEVACTQIGGVNVDFLLTKAPTSSPGSNIKTGSNINNGGGNSRRELDETDDTWEVCAGHGTFNTTTHSCDCDLGWQLEYAGNGYNDFPIYLCTDCTPVYGPSPTFSSSLYSMSPNTTSFCSAIYTPSPIDGTVQLCSGGGNWIGNECSCFSSDELGYYNLTSYSIVEDIWVWQAEGIYTLEPQTFTVQTCAACNKNLTLSTPDQGCR